MNMPASMRWHCVIMLVINREIKRYMSVAAYKATQMNYNIIMVELSILHGLSYHTQTHTHTHTEHDMCQLRIRSSPNIHTHMIDDQ